MLLWLVGGCLLSTVSADVDKLIISCKTGSLSLVDSNGTYRPLYDLNEEISKMGRADYPRGGGCAVTFVGGGGKVCKSTEVNLGGGKKDTEKTLVCRYPSCTATMENIMSVMETAKHDQGVRCLAKKLNSFFFPAVNTVDSLSSPGEQNLLINDNQPRVQFLHLMLTHKQFETRLGHGPAILLWISSIFLTVAGLFFSVSVGYSMFQLLPSPSSST